MLADVALNAPLRAGDRAFTFAVPADLLPHVRPGVAVRVPFGRQTTTGFVVGFTDGASRQVKPLAGVDERVPPLPPDLVELGNWMAEHYVCSIGEALWAMIPPLSALARRSRAAPAPDDAVPPAPAPGAPGEIADRLDADPAARTVVIGDDGRFAVYLDALRWVARSGGGTIVLVPEVVQAERLAAWVRRHVAVPAVLLHGELGDGARWAVWRALAGGEARIVVGTRLAVFAPLPALGLVIVDHEEDASYKEERAPRYHARRVAEERARRAGAAVLYGSPAPSLEVMREVAERRAAALARPPEHRATIALSDVRAEAGPLGGLFGRRLYQALARTLPRGRAIVYVPRRGYADFLLCHECGWVPRCARCGVAMTYHVRQVRLHCHLCGDAQPVPEVCRNCRGTHLRPHGVGTERVEQAARRLFRGTPVLRLDAETAPDEPAQQDRWALFGRRGGLLVGTQLLVKGVGQLPAAVVGVIGVDAGLHLPDFRAAERTYQILTRLSALAQREMIVQTFAPAHPALVALARGDAERFYREELAARQRFGYPPSRTLVNVVTAGVDPDAVREAAQRVAAGLADAGDVLGPSPAPLARVRGRYRWQLLVKEDPEGAARRRLAAVMRTLDLPRDVRVVVDVDPVDVL